MRLRHVKVTNPASTVIDSTPFCIFTVDGILLRIELFRKAPSPAPGPTPETSPAPAPDASAPTTEASSPTPMMSPPAPPTLSPDGDPKDCPAADSKNSTAGKKKNVVPVAPIRNETKDCIIIDVEDYKASGYSDVPIFVQHTEVMMEEIDRMDEEIEMEDAEDWSVVDIDNSDKKNELAVVEYNDDIYAYNKKAEVEMLSPLFIFVC
ncbi:Cyclin-B2-4 [Capsicum baccatum]|uniref:Cyclin-B2-4 n=1 Tax=Capsicum baccatum TaxID=33114 RepID=A0A2G2XIU3_CAPBA|nr:Cyclin-B2-4 [Capsicum baccatum]